MATPANLITHRWDKRADCCRRELGPALFSTSWRSSMNRHLFGAFCTSLGRRLDASQRYPPYVPPFSSFPLTVIVTCKFPLRAGRRHTVCLSIVNLTLPLHLATSSSITHFAKAAVLRKIKEKNGAARREIRRI